MTSKVKAGFILKPSPTTMEIEEQTTMTQTTSLKAAKKFGPGYFIREQMEYRDWTQEDLAEITGLSLKHINKILQDKQPLTLEVAKLFGEIFNTSPQYWINLDTGYRLWLVQGRSQNEIEVDIKGMIYERMPVKDMLAKGWLKPIRNVADLKQQVLEFWEWEELSFETIDRDYSPCLNRKSEAFNQFNASYAITWYRKAILEAKKFKVPEFSRNKLESLFDDLHTYTVKEDGIPLFIDHLAQSGVIFFVLPHLQKTYLDGAAFLLDETPVIVYTGRYKRIDNFWFTIAHEIAHILLHLEPNTPFVLDNFKDGYVNKIEEEANDLAGIKLKYPEIMESLSSSLHYLTTTHIEVCAVDINIHPAIIIGKLAHDRQTSYRNQRLYNENVLDLIPQAYQ